MSCKHSNRAARQAAPGYFALIQAGEPFRLLFPVGAVLGIIGAALWPLYAWKFMATYPGVIHSRVMIEGFLTAFVIGFLGTALPRLLDVPRMTLWEAGGFTFSLLLITICHLTGHTLEGDQLFFFTLIGLVGVLVTRLVFRKDTPPPAFVLVAMGILSAVTGSAIQAVAGIAPTMVPPWISSFGRLLLNQGYLLLPVMGIGAFILPRFFALPNRQNFKESLTPPPGWGLKALFAAACGLTIFGSFLLEAGGQARIGCGLRAAVVAFYFAHEVPVHRAGFGGGSLALALRVALASIPLGYALMAFEPRWISSFIHVVMISGFSLLTLCVASRVLLGHSGQAEKFAQTLKPVVIMMTLVLLAMLTRVTADWMPKIQLSHYAYAAAAWILGVIIWGVALLPSVRRADSEA